MKKNARVSIKITPDLKDRLLAEAARKDRSLNWIVTELLERALRRRSRRSGPDRSKD